MIDTLSIRGAYRGKTLPETTIQILCDEIDRLRGEHQTPPQGKMVDVKFYAYVDFDGNAEIPNFNISASGNAYQYDPGMYGNAIKITATLPVPAEVCVEARVSND